ncbi:hypothetical protein A2Z67_01750 [Candidatus Woesebacteria bacterium RBG_13_36_22]|uniref:Uncharacterized protein n=1 Tax=Candidatus Woesebacteria bacterium RBG_13_36_22 TaxID=1802478 RepID=A0A1F7X2K8_9BACT|nr:MAG: hypothetical protein A2Z67_01750 [Candidatus Woesebacteria bacterium RBG_13_36_22]
MIETAWHKGLVNYHQTPLERKLKYFTCRYLGDNSYRAFRRRDWRWNKIARVHGWYNFLEMKDYLEKGLKEAIVDEVSNRKLTAK